MTKRDYYEILGVARGVDANELKKAYRRVALESHPDRNPGDHAAEERFKEASEAYEVLSDPEKRKIYDAYGHQGLNNSGFGGFHSAEDIFSSFGDIFEDLFGMGGGRRGRSGGQQRRGQAGQDLQAEVEITLEEAAHGVEREVSIQHAATCGVCGGNGAKPGTTRETCRTCDGSGHITSRQGFFMLQTTCPHCHGEGSRIEHACTECRGHGVVRASRKLVVKIPPGVEGQMQLVMRGEGSAGTHGGPAGDVYVLVHIAPHADFRRDGDDIHTRVEITFSQAALGTRLTVPTLYEKRELKIPAGTDSGTVLRLKGDGIKNVRTGHLGNQFVEVMVRTPKKLSRQQRELIEALQATDE